MDVVLKVAWPGRSGHDVRALRRRAKLPARTSSRADSDLRVRLAVWAGHSDTVDTADVTKTGVLP